MSDGAISTVASQGQLHQLLEAAHYMMMPDLLKRVVSVSVSHLNERNVLNMLTTAEVIRHEQLKSACIDYVRSCVDRGTLRTECERLMGESDIHRRVLTELLIALACDDGARDMRGGAQSRRNEYK
jgi:hypothetical protein